MNRTEWDACKDPLLLLRAMQSQGSERKFRLLGCAIADAAASYLGGWTPLQEKRLARYEEFAEGHGSLAATPVSARGHIRSPQPAERLAEALSILTEPSASGAALAVCVATLGPLYRRVFYDRKPVADDMRVHEPILHAQRHLIHDALDHRMRLAPLLLGDAGDAPDVQNLARSIYADKSFADMPVLGDALEDAGCDDAEALDHCRHHPLHARGCWVVDLLLGKE